MVAAMAAVLLASATAVGWGEDEAGSAWLRQPPDSVSVTKGWVAVPTKDAYEVVASREAWAVVLLEKEPIVPLSAELARSLAGDHFIADPDKKPYLVRAVCGHGATGGYTLSRRGRELLIAHGSLGRHRRYQRSAFIVNFDVPPTELYLTVSIAE